VKRIGLVAAVVAFVTFLLGPQSAPTDKPEWCRSLPRPEYKTLNRVPVDDPWFEIFQVVPQVFAIYEPHQAEETISYLILGEKQALLFDTGMGMGDIRKVTAELTHLPIIVLNSHTHDDHVGGNWQFETVYGMDTDFTRTNAKGSRQDAQDELGPGMICGELPKGFDSKSYATRPWKISRFLHDHDKIDLGGRTLEILSTPGHTPDAISLLDRERGLLFSGDTYYPAPIWLFRPETNLDDYVASVKHLAALAPQLRLVIGAHNVPFAQPAVLATLVTAIETVRAGKVRGELQDDGKALYRSNGVSFLMLAHSQEKP
jgi:glyoxylase-like metal-dependent hydrolase (beta-lactamase superfamily II)